MKAFLNHIHPVEEDILEEYLSHWKECSFPKNTLMTSEGEIEKYMYFVLEGMQKSFYLNDTKEHIIAFTHPPSFSGIPDSFFSQSKSRYFLKTISKSTFLRISFEKHQELMAQFRPIETLFRKGTEVLLTDTLGRYYELMAYDIETRFKNFVTRSPRMLNHISQKDLASYLRIDPSNFSKLLNSVKL